MNVRAYIAEFVGTFSLVWVGIYVIHHLGAVPGGLLGIAFAHGLAIALLVTATMHVSGGHLNPAVTMAMLMCKKIKFLDALAYIVVQLAAGYVAAMAITLVPLFDGQSAIEGAMVVANGTPTITDALNGQSLDGQAVANSAWFLEALATFFLVIAIFGSAVDKRAPKMGGLYIGLAVMMGILAIGPLTGAAMNPARWMGPAFVSDLVTTSAIPLKHMFFTYFLGPVTGAIVGAFLYQLVFTGKEQLQEEAAA